MPDSLSADIQTKLSDLCRGISAERNLDAQQQEQLRLQAEDAFRAYLDDDKPLSEDEAFVLVREHFGDPSVVKELFDRVHTWEARATLGRRLAAAFILMFALSTLVHALRSAFLIPSMLWLGSGRDSQFLVSFMESQLTFIVPGLLVPLILWLCLRNWQRAVERGDRVWFLEWTPRQLIAMLVLLYFAKDFNVSIRPSSERLSALFPPGPNQFPWALYVVAFIVCAIECGVIFWWCDRPPRRRRAIAYTLSAWMVSVLAPTLLISEPVHVLVYTDLGSSIPAGGTFFSLGQLPIFAASWHVGLTVDSAPGIVRMLNVAGLFELGLRLRDLLIVHGYSLLAGLLAASAYLVIRYRKGEMSIRSPFGPRMSGLMDMMPMDEDEHARDDRNGD